jgi:translation initiation factor 4A
MATIAMTAPTTALAAQPTSMTPALSENADVRIVPSFDEMPLNQALLRGIYSHGFEKPSPIQQSAILPMIRGSDIIAQAQSGTGKTGAFTIALLQRMDLRHRHPQAMVLAPTRELAQQTESVLASIGAFMCEGYPISQTFVGGRNVVEDLRRLQAGTIVAIGTPGRMADLIRRGALRMDALKTVVLDEADEMLSQGFVDQIYEIFRFVPRDVQVALFSATIPDGVLEMSKKFMRSPTRILMRPEVLTLDAIKQYYVAVDEAQKLEVMTDLFETVSVAQSVIFVNSRRKADYVADYLNRNHHTVSLMHADMAKGERDAVMSKFRSGAARVLVTTDVIARGIDVHHVNFVINFDLPASAECYLHRIGRSGRYGRKGIAINLVSPADEPQLRALMRHYHTSIGEMPADFAAYLGE